MYVCGFRDLDLDQFMGDSVGVGNLAQTLLYAVFIQHVHSREVYRYAYLRDSQLLLFPEGLADLLEHVPVYSQDGAVLLEFRDELRRLDDRSVGLDPSAERFRTYKPLGFGIVHGLVESPEFLRDHGLVDCLSHAIGVVGRLLGHRNLSLADEDAALEHYAVLGSALSYVQLGICFSDDIALTALVRACQRTSDSDRDIVPHSVVIALEPEFLDDFLDLDCRHEELFFRDIFHDGHEFAAVVPEHPGFLSGKEFSRSLSYPGQDHVALGV